MQAGVFHICTESVSNLLIKGNKMASSSQVSFSMPQRVLHWAMALLIFFNLLFPDGMEHAYRLMRRGEALTSDQISSANIHAYVGFAILGLALLTFYALFFILPLSGIAAYYFGVQAAGQLHSGPFKVLMWVLIVAHIAAALVHQFYWKTDVVRRMTHG